MSVSTVKISKKLEIQDGGGRHLEKIEKSSYLGRGLTDFDEIWHGTQFGSLERSDH